MACRSCFYRKLRTFSKGSSSSISCWARLMPCFFPKMSRPESWASVALNIFASSKCIDSRSELVTLRRSPHTVSFLVNWANLGALFASNFLLSNSCFKVILSCYSRPADICWEIDNWVLLPAWGLNASPSAIFRRTSNFFEGSKTLIPVNGSAEGVFFSELSIGFRSLISLWSALCTLKGYLELTHCVLCTLRHLGFAISFILKASSFVLRLLIWVWARFISLRESLNLKLSFWMAVRQSLYRWILLTLFANCLPTVVAPSAVAFILSCKRSAARGIDKFLRGFFLLPGVLA